MKTIKKALAILLSMLMVMSITVVAVATTTTPDTYRITITNSAEGYTYDAYQIFSGDIATVDGKTVLSNVKWGSGVNSATLLSKLIEYNTLDNVPGTADPVVANVLKGCFDGITASSSAQAVAEKLAGIASDSKKTIAFAELAAQCLTDTKTGSTYHAEQTHYDIDVPNGYYLVKNTTIPDDNDGDPNHAYSSIILSVVGDNVEVNHKAEAPTLDKQVKHDTGDWGNVDDSQIGDKVEFRIITSVPDTTGYSKYTYTIHDKLSSGLKFNGKSSVELYTGEKGKEGTQKIDAKYYTVLTLAENGTDLVAHDPQNPETSKCTFVVKVKMLDLIKDGVVTNGNGNIYTYYSATLTEAAKVYGEKEDNKAHLEYSNNPLDEKETDDTPEKKVYEWTYKINYNKVDGTTKAKLDGAVFVLSKTPALTIAADDDGKPTDNLANLIPVVAGTGDNAGSYTVDATKKGGDAGAAYIITGEGATIKGLDVGTYYLYETKAPDGYNKLTQPVVIKITANYNDDGDTSTPTITVDDKTANNGNVGEFDIANKKGSTLPETGGIGTTIFYVVGGAMMFVAVVLLVTKKKMSKNNK